MDENISHFQLEDVTNATKESENTLVLDKDAGVNESVEDSTTNNLKSSEPEGSLPKIQKDKIPEKDDINEMQNETTKVSSNTENIDSSETKTPDVLIETDNPDASEKLEENMEAKSNEDIQPINSSDSSACKSQENLDKNMELENTEFVQFSQEKHDDTLIENHSMDAEDPFGCDGLQADNVELIETENNTSFQKLNEQSDNLQDIVNAENTFDKPISEINTNKPSNLEQSSVMNQETEESVESHSDSVISKNPQKNNEDLPGKEKNSDECNESTSKNTMETDQASIVEEEQSDVLPGQDDEICIIPDSMKVIIPEKSVQEKSVDNTENSAAENLQEENKDEETSDGPTAASSNSDKELVSSNTNGSEKDTNLEEAISTTEAIVSSEDVINIDEEAKSLDTEEVGLQETCKQCNKEISCKFKVKIGSESYNVCSKACKEAFNTVNNKAMDIPSDGVNSKREKRCASCLLIVEANDDKNLSWETMEFCNEECLGKFQTKYGSYCRNCNGTVQAVSLGKYCVRFGYDVRQFCCSTCLEEFKKGLKVCSYCQKDISSGEDGFLAPVGDKGQFKDFCTQGCMEKYTKINSMDPPNLEKKSCSVCQEEKVVHCEVQIGRASPVAICSEPCFAAYKFVNKVDPDICSTCKKFFESPNKKSFVVFYENEAHTFCTKTCLNVFIIANRKIVPCNWCKVKKYNFDMIKKEIKTGQVIMMCSLNCLTLYQVSINAVSAKRINCDFCKEYSQAQYHLTMSDATIRNFCSYNCVMNFQAQYTKSPITIPSSDDPVPTGMPKRTVPSKPAGQTVVQKPTEIGSKKAMPVISSVTSLATIGNGQTSPPTAPVQTQTSQIIYKQQFIARPTSPVKVHNKNTQCKPIMHTKKISVRPHPCTKSTQTENPQQVLVPIPVPIYVPFPMFMYSMPFPVPVPFPLPIPVPIFIPTTRNSAKGIFKDIKRIQEKIPSDPFEAELLMMAEMVATEKKNDSDSDSVDESPETVDSSNAFGDDMLQMALKMATGELDEPAVDLEAALTPNTITATQAPASTDSNIENDGSSERLLASTRGKKRVLSCKPRSTASKRGRRTLGANDVPIMPPSEPQPPPQARIIEPIEKPDANMALKYTFGVNAWRQWVTTKNAELEKQISSTKKGKLFKTDILQLTADELNYSLCLFVKEVRKPNGTEYAPDTIYYLCLGIQQYLFENNRIDNIFTDSYYETFTSCLNDVAKKFSVLYNDAQYIVTRVEEEHLWECKQLGAHSPHVLLSTLMFFNTKHFNLVTVDEHMQLSFSHIMKHWKRNPATQAAASGGKVPGSRNVLLRFYPPQSALEGNTKKKKVYEQQENEENPLRCPVKLYEFYLSKCPESVKTRNDVFYLLPERSCVPDSPVWYSTSPLAKDNLVKMLNRVKMVKEINVALLTS